MLFRVYSGGEESNNPPEGKVMPKIKPAKKYKGHIFKRGTIYWLQYSSRNADGMIIRLSESLKTTSKPVAETRATEITAPLLHRGDAAKLEKVLRERLAGANEKAERLESDRNRILLTKVWERHPYDTAVRGNIRRPLKPKVVVKHRQLWQAFADWIIVCRPGTKYLEDITPADALAYSEYCRQIPGCGARGHNDRIKICRVIFDLAGMKPNPFANIKKWSETNEGRDCLELADLQKIMLAATGEMRTLVLVGLFTGLRLGDAVNLRWQDIKDNRIYKVTGKTGKPVSLGVAPLLAVEFSKLDRPADGKGFVVPELAMTYKKDPQKLCRQVRRLFEGAGIEVVEHVPGRARAVSRRGFHSLRTSFVSICARAGVPTELISQWAGHSPQINAIYQKFGNKERDTRILGALQSVVLTLPEISPEPAPAIDVEGREVTARERLLAMVQEMTEAQVAEVLARLDGGL